MPDEGEIIPELTSDEDIERRAQELQDRLTQARAKRMPEPPDASHLNFERRDLSRGSYSKEDTKNYSGLKDLGVGMQIAYAPAGSILGFLIIGIAMDHFLKTQTWTLVGLVVGLVSAGFFVLKYLGKLKD